MAKSAGLVLSLLLLFLLCVIPISVFNILQALELNNKEYDVPLGIALFMIYWVQYALNCILYAASNRNYRLAYKYFLVTCLCPAASEDSTLVWGVSFSSRRVPPPLQQRRSYPLSASEVSVRGRYRAPTPLTQQYLTAPRIHRQPNHDARLS